MLSFQHVFQQYRTIHLRQGSFAAQDHSNIHNPWTRRSNAIDISYWEHQLTTRNTV
jgi:hypothetical protein